MKKSDGDASEISLEALRRGQRGRLILWVVWLLLILAGGIGWWIFRPQLTAEVQAVRRGDAVSAVYGTVLVEPVQETIIKAQSAGVVAEVKAKKGDVVKESDVLAVISDEVSNVLLRETQTALENAMRTREIGAPTAPAADSKRRQLEQLKKLLDEGNIARSEYDRNASELKTLEDKVKTEMLTLDAAVEQAKQKVDAARSNDTQRYVKAPQNGVIMDFFTQLGQVISKNEQIYLIGSEQSHIRALVNEEDVGGLKDGMTAIVRLYSYPGQDFEATLKEVLPRGSNREYSVILNLNKPPERLLPGMTGELNIIIGKRENTLILPTRAVRTGVSPTVYVVSAGVVRSVPVKLGFRSIEMVEILEGLNEGDEVILSDHDLFKPGQEVKIRSR